MSTRAASMARSPVDPVSFEIVRRRLAAISDEAAITVMRISGSQVVTEAADLNAVICNRDGEIVVSALYMLVHTCALNGLIRFLVEEYVDNPGFGPGDMFLTNDPYVTGLHQPDAVLVAPIYRDGRLIAWCGTTVHESDVGGPVPGSIAVGSRSIYDEPIPMAPVRIVESGRIRRDLEREYLIRSRTPELNSLDLLGQVAANRLQTERVLALCDRYGEETVTGTMDWLIESTEARLRERLEALPDGRWCHVGYVEHDGVEDRVYPVRLTMTKSGGHLDLDYTESADQAPGLINCPVDLTRAFVLATLLPLLGFDQVPWVPAAFERVVTLRTRPGTVTHATWPAGVSLGGTSTGHEVRTALNACLARMLDQSPDDRRYILASSMSSAPGQTIAGRRHDGSTYASMLLDAQLGGGGARTGADGPDTFGLLHSPGGACANVEVNEANFPIRYLWRAERVDSGGPGTHRGGVGGCHALTPHRSTGPVEMTVWAHGIEQPAATGLFGGEAAAPNAFVVLRGAAGAVGPEMARLDPALLPGPAEVPQPKERLTVGPGDVVLSLCSGGGGVGDPLDRTADRVLADVREGLVSPQGAASDYAVALVADGDGPDGWRVDEDATAQLRRNRRERRRSGGEPGPGPVLGMAGARSVACPRCGSRLGGPGTFVAERLPASYRWAPAAELPGTGRFSVERLACAACLTQLDSVVRLTTTEPAG